MDTTNVLKKLINHQDLTEQESGNLLEVIIDGMVSPIQTAAILTALRMKGETADEIVGLVKVMRKHMIHVETSGVVIDTCGTGGDGKSTLNISTGAAIVVAAAGVKVAKHGNRAATSLCGSADVLEALGVNVTLSPIQAAKILNRVGIVFLFAPLFHPATKNVVSVRKDLGIKTVFNYLGPLVNPCGVKRQLVGVPDQNISKILAHVATQLDYQHIVFVTSQDGTDEITLLGKTYAIEVKEKLIREFVIDPLRFGFTKYKDGKIVGGSAKENAFILRSVFSGTKGVVRDTIVANAAAALYIAGKVPRIEDGISIAEKSIDNGRTHQVLERLVEASNHLV